MTEIQIKQVIGQQEASIDKVEEFLKEDEFKEYCDAVATTVTYLKVINKRIKAINNEV